MPGSRSAARLLALGLGAGCVAAILYLSYEMGRYQAGFAIMQVRREAASREALIGEQAATIEELEQQVAILGTAREVDRETYAQVETTLEQLEQQIQSQQEELAFYQGIVSPEDGAAGLRIQDFTVDPGDTARAYAVRLVLVQAIVHSQRITGRVTLAITGRREGGERVTLSGSALGASDGSDTITYAFRYFQTVGFDVVLPPGFSAEAVEVRIEPSQPSGEAVVESYAWPF